MIAELLKENARPLIMGVLNVTPDSFSDGGMYMQPGQAVARAKEMILQGADIIDIGAESTRPGAVTISAGEEWRRLSELLPALLALGHPLSIDTQKAEIARRACAAGIAIINDVWGLQGDPAMADVAAEYGADVIAMHNRDDVDPDIDILAEIDAWFEKSIAIAEKAGMPLERLTLDPGFGFGKNIEQNFRIIAHLERFLAHGCPLLVGASRKRMIGAVLDVPPCERDHGSLGAHIVAVVKGASIIRAHAVKAHIDAIKVAHRCRSD